MRFATWCAVSTTVQAQDDKASLSEQERQCQQVGHSKGWQNTELHYTVPGESRTRWVNLRDAENEIPALHQMLEHAKAHKFDLLLLYDYNRLRDLLDPVAKTLASYGVQIYSVNQPVEPLPPEEFHPYASDSESIMRGMSQIISRWQIADLRRKFIYGVTARVRKGLHSTRLPYAYRRPPGREADKNAVAILLPDRARTVVAMKDMFLTGKTYIEIADHLNRLGILTTNGNQWEHSIIKRVLLNPFYAGKVFFRRTRTIHDPHLNTTRLIQNPNPLLADGLHPPLYTWDDHLAILAEDQRRRTLPRHNRYPFSGLLQCSICRKTLVRDGSYRTPVWHCPGKYHTLLRDEEAYTLIPRVLQQTLQNLPSPNTPTIGRIFGEGSGVGSLEHQRRRIQQAYESELYTIEEAETRIKQIDVQIQEYKNGEVQRLRRQAQHQQLLATIEQTRAILQHLPAWVKTDDPRTVNTLLLRLCRHITVTPEGKLTVHLRD